MLRRLATVLVVVLAIVALPCRVIQPAALSAPQTLAGDGVAAFLATRGEFPSLVEVQLFTPANDHPLTTAITGLITGAPASAPFRSMLLPSTKLNSAAVAADGIARLDFSSDILTANVGSFGEAMLIASVANTAAQFPTVQSVQFLVDGKSVESLAGHILASEPLAPNYSFAPQGFTDAVRHWAERQINAMALRGVINGYADGTYRPDRAVSRAEIIKLVTAATDDIDWSVTAQSFADVSPAYPLCAYIETAVRRGILKPADYRLPDGACRLNPDAPCTRREAAVMLVRAAGLNGRATELAGQPLPWKDTRTQPAWAAGVLLAAAERGLMNGYPDGTFLPAGTLTRAEAATVVARLIGCKPGPVIAAAVRGTETLGVPGLLVAGVCPTGALLRLDTYSEDGTVLTSHSLSLRKLTAGCSYFAAIVPASQLSAQAVAAEVLALSGSAVTDRWSLTLPPR